MNKGAFALLDCLGFKGIWKTTSPEAVIGKLANIDQWLSSGDLIKKLPFLDKHRDILTAKIILLSDTIAVSVVSSKEFEPIGFIPLSLLLNLVQEVNRRFLLESPHLLLRGSITFGDHLASERFMIGPAVDRAAEYEKLPNGAFIWLEPEAARQHQQFCEFMNAVPEVPIYPDSWRDKAEEVFKDTSRELATRTREAVQKVSGLDNPVIAGYNMPIKGGDYLPCSILNPFYKCLTEEEIQVMYEIFEKQLSNDRIDVLIKKGNTLAFLNECRKVRSSYLTRNSSVMREFFSRRASVAKPGMDAEPNSSSEETSSED
jgi:hypothetical protein